MTEVVMWVVGMGFASVVCIVLALIWPVIAR